MNKEDTGNLFYMSPNMMIALIRQFLKNNVMQSKLKKSVSCLLLLYICFVRGSAMSDLTQSLNKKIFIVSHEQRKRV